MPHSRRELGKALVPLRVAGFVALACLAILALSGWREWESREVDLRNAELDMANLARSLTQHAEDTFDLADTILTGMVDRMEIGGTTPAAVAKIQTFLQARKYNLGNVSAASSSTTRPAAGLPRLKKSTSPASTTATATTSGVIELRTIAGP
ncbi:hypothetical protein ACVWZL_004975 [Bradyrhizobium sp. GM2.4]